MGVTDAGINGDTQFPATSLSVIGNARDPGSPGLTGGDLTQGVRLVLEMMLRSPHFLYHLESGAGEPGMGNSGMGNSGLGSDGAVRALTAFEVASRLSYFLWGTMPDPPLFEAARSGALLAPGTW